MGSKSSSQNRRKGVLLIFGFAIAVLAIFLLLGSERQDPAQSAEETQSLSPDSRGESAVESTVETRAQSVRQLDKMQEMLTQQVRKAKQVSRANSARSPDAERPQPAPAETPQLRPSTRHQRRTTRELIVLDAVFGMMKNGETEKALLFLAEQRSLFPEENAVESEAFEVIAGCIEAKNEATGKVAADFVKTHEDFRLNRHIKRLCIE